MTLGVGNLVALICIVISIIFAIVTTGRLTRFGGRCSQSSQFCGGELARRGADPRKLPYISGGQRHQIGKI